MPDQFGFDHLPRRGSYTHRCVECGWPGGGVSVIEDNRRKHHDAHMRAVREETERTRRQNAAKARAAKRQIERENSRAYRQEGHE